MAIRRALRRALAPASSSPVWPGSLPAVLLFHFRVTLMAGILERAQVKVIDYLLAENRVLGELATIVTPDTLTAVAQETLGRAVL